MPYDIIVGRDKTDKEKFGGKGLIFLGRGFVKMGTTTSLSNNIFMDVARSHVVLVAGKRGCLTPDTLVFTNKGYIKIDEYNEELHRILSFDKEKIKFQWENAKLLRYTIDNEDLIQIELKDGRILKVTKEHPLLCSYGKYKFYRQAKDLKENDKIVLPLKLPEVKNDKESLRIARLLGFVMADGSIGIKRGRFKDGRNNWYNGTKARVRFYNNSNNILRQAKEDLELEFKIKAKRYKRNDCNCEVVESKNQKVIKKLINFGIPSGKKSHLLRVPKIVMESSNKFKSEFISALFDCDGFIDDHCKTIDYSSKSREFLTDIQLILTHLDIESVIRENNSKLNGKIFKNYKLFITDNKSIGNFKKIGFRHEMKKARLSRHYNNKTRKRKTHYISDHLVCNRISSIKPLSNVKEVFDLSVPKNNSFIANGVISHNSGKSYTLGVMAEELSNLPGEASKNIGSLIFDTMGIFWTMKFKNEKEKELLKEWGLEPKELPVNVFVPFGKEEEYKKRKIPFDETFGLKPSELEADDWNITFNLSMTSQAGVLISKVVTDLKEDGKDFTIKDILKEIKSTKGADDESKNIASALFQAADTWGIFARSISSKEKGTQISDLVEPGKTTILDLSVYSSVGSFNIRGLVIGLVSRKLFEQRINARKKEEMESISHGADYLTYQKEREVPLAWIFIDEAHEFLPKTGKTPASDALIQLLREGRQPGISLVLATQQPGEIHKDVMTQSDIVISHRVTSQPDIESLNMIMQTYLLSNIKRQMDDLPALKGSAIILDDNSERIYPMRIRPRFTWHGGEAPTAIKIEVKI